MTRKKVQFVTSKIEKLITKKCSPTQFLTARPQNNGIDFISISFVDLRGTRGGRVSVVSLSVVRPAPPRCVWCRERKAGGDGARPKGTYRAMDVEFSAFSSRRTERESQVKLAPSPVFSTAKRISADLHTLNYHVKAVATFFPPTKKMETEKKKQDSAIFRGIAAYP